MQSFNQTIMIGRLTRDPESKSIQDVNKCTFSLAVNRSYTKDDGKRDTDFFQVVAWGKLAEICQNYLKKGRLVLIDGRFQTRSYESNGKKNYVTELIADRMQILDSNAKESEVAEPMLQAA